MVMFKQPLCGQRWLDKHAHDHTLEEINSLTIQVSVNGRKFKADSTTKRGTVKQLTKLMRED